MLKLDVAANPFWIEILPGQRTQFRPITTPMILAARNRASQASLAAIADAGKGAVSDPDQADAVAGGQFAFTRALAELGIVAWEGVCGPDGQPVEPTAENIARYLSNWRIFDQVENLYVLPALVRTDEKNGFSPSQNGTTGARTRGKNIAATVKRRAGTAPIP